MKRNRLARRPLLLLLSLLMLLGIFSTASAEESTNLLQNPGFEEIGADGLPVGWKTDAYLNLEGVTFYTVSDNAMSGAHSVQIENLTTRRALLPDSRGRAEQLLPPVRLCQSMGYAR